MWTSKELFDLRIMLKLLLKRNMHSLICDYRELYVTGGNVFSSEKRMVCDNAQ